ncbi:MAG: tRNA lysidine(34) synthetase TilS, partial [Armatimonadota bacterium]|nr:tRNA lysidine(34) synthetase TilS [Armatimonadota bacterium]
YCAAQALEPRRDPSNFSPDAYTRNRVRLELLPQLEHDYNPGVRQALLRLSEIAGRDLDYLQAQTAEALAAATAVRRAEKLVLDCSRLRELHPALLRRVLRAAVAQVRGTAEGIAFHHIERMCRILERPSGADAVKVEGLFPAPFCDIARVYDTITLIRVALQESTGLAAFDALVPLLIPGEATLSQTGWTVRALLEDRKPPRPNSGEPEKSGEAEIEGRGLSCSGSPELGRGGLTSQASLDADAIHGYTLTLRGWQDGDRIDPLGMGGRHKKVSDIFMDAKVPRLERQRVPIITDSQGIVWIVGFCVSERVKITAATMRTLSLVAERLPLS